MGVVGDDTAPKSAPVHSPRSVASVRSGSATPVSWNVPKPAGSVVKLNERPVLLLSASSTRRPACRPLVESVARLNGTHRDHFLANPVARDQPDVQRAPGSHGGAGRVLREVEMENVPVLQRWPSQLLRTFFG